MQQDSICLSIPHQFIHSRIYIAPLQGNYSEVLPTPARQKEQTNTSRRRSYMKHSLRIKITIIFSAIQLNVNLHYDSFVNPASTYTYYRPFILSHQSKVTETSYFL